MKKISAYWICQIIGWVLYALGIIFFTKLFKQQLEFYQIERLILAIVLGIILTHLMRVAIHKFSLKPPIVGVKWIEISIVLFITILLYSFINSACVEYLGLYNESLKFTIFNRFFLNLISDGPTIFMWATMYYVWQYIKVSQRSELDKIRLETLVKELELKTIKSHINPHFIFNALNSIRALIDENPQRARTAITELSNILRSSMIAEKLETSPLEKEINIVKDYLALEKIRFEERLKVEFDIVPETLAVEVPPMMLQTLVENAIKHGISKQLHGGIVRVGTYIAQSNLLLIVQNSGTIKNAYRAEGFGISSTQNRLQLMYANKAKFELKEINTELVEASVLIPLHKS